MSEEITRERDMERIAGNFESYNPYAASVSESEEPDITGALLAVAFELSQLRYIINTKVGNSNGRRRS